MIILIYKVLAPPRTFHDNYSQAYGGNNLRDSLQTIPLTHVMEKTLNSDGLTDPFHTVNFYPCYLLISLCWKKYTLYFRKNKN